MKRFYLIEFHCPKQNNSIRIQYNSYHGNNNNKDNNVGTRKF